MPRKLFRLLLALAALAFVAGACSSSDDDDNADDEDTEEVEDTSKDDNADDNADDEGDDTSDDEGDDESDSEGPNEDAVALVEDLGFSSGSAECIVTSLEDQGIDVDGLDQGDVASPSSDLSEALAQAGADCVSEISEDGLPAGSTDLSNPQVYDAFVEGFASTSGLGTETAECVADYFLDNGIDPADVLADGGSTVVTDALAECQ